MGDALFTILVSPVFLNRIPTPIALIRGCGVREVKTFVPPLRPLIITMLAIWVSSRLFLGYRAHGRAREHGLVPPTRNLRGIGLIGVDIQRNRDEHAPRLEKFRCLLLGKRLQGSGYHAQIALKHLQINPQFANSLSGE